MAGAANEGRINSQTPDAARREAKSGNASKLPTAAKVAKALSALLGFSLVVTGSLAAAPIDDARLRDANADRADWLTYGRDYGNQRFSPLSQINRDTIQDLAPRWIYQTGVAASFQATPLVVDGVLYLSTPFDHVAAIEASSGRELWRYEHKRTSPKMCCGPANRGVAVAYGKVFIGTVDNRLVALDAKTGQVVWDIAVAENGDPSETLHDPRL